MEHGSREIIALEWNSHISYKKEREDFLVVDEEYKIFVVADGVGRIKNEKGEYPYPSPAKMASKVASEAITESLKGGKDMKRAFANGNEAVKKLNEEIGLWENHDYLVNDFAGTVGVAAVEKENKIEYGYIGDCGIAHFSASGDLLWHSDDDVAAARPGFPPMEGEPAFAQASQKVNERFIKVRRDFRNNPTASHKTFGVLTGEDTALEYVKMGSLTYRPGDVIVIYSDGISPFILEDIEFQKLLFIGNKEEMRKYVDERSSKKEHYGEKTIIVLRK